MPAKLRNTLLVLFAVAAVALVAIGVSGWKAGQKELRWKKSVEAAGGEVVTAGYGGGPLAKVPILGEFFGHKQLEVFVPDNDAARKLEPLIRSYPPLGRLWIHKVKVSPELHAALSKARPDVDVVRYTRSGE